MLLTSVAGSSATSRDVSSITKVFDQLGLRRFLRRDWWSCDQQSAENCLFGRDRFDGFTITFVVLPVSRPLPRSFSRSSLIARFAICAHSAILTTEVAS